jgi:putative adhesin
MEPMNRIPTLLVIPMLLAGPAGATETLREQSERELDAAGVVTIAVENPRGVVRVSPDAGGRIRVTALKIVRAHDAETAQKFARETKVSLTTQGGKCRIMVQYPQHQQVRVGLWQMMSGDFEFPGVEVRLALTVPRALQVSLRSTSGDLFTEDIDGRQDLDTTSGEIGVSVAGGAVRASTTSGDIRVSARGAARLRSVSGSLTAEQVGGPLDAHTTSGELVVLGAQDSLALGTVSGDIRVERAPHGIAATTTSGAQHLERRRGRAAGAAARERRGFFEQR